MNPDQNTPRISVSSQQLPEDELLFPSRQIDERNLNRIRLGHKEPAPMDLDLAIMDMILRPTPLTDEEFSMLPTPQTDEELIWLADLTIRRFRPPKPEGVYDEADVNWRKASTDVGYVYIEEALKGPEMNPTWRRKIFSQRPEDDDQELRELVESRLSHYSPDIVVDDYLRNMHRYAALEQREYEKDLKATGGFEVGHYPYTGRAGFMAIHRFYCPPETNLPDDGVIRLFGLASHAIQVYNSKEQTNFYLVKVIKTMTLPAAGVWYFMTFEASSPSYGD